MSPPTVDDAVSGAFASEPDELDAITDTVTGFITEQVASAGRDGVVVAIGGELNSAVVAMLAADALDTDGVFGLILPAYLRTEADAFTAELIAEGLGIEYTKVQLLPFVHLVQELSLPDAERSHDLTATTNAVDRLRMTCAYYAADALDRLVVGTIDRTECLLGTATPFGVRWGDILPLGDLYGTEVEALATHIGIPDEVYESPDHGLDRPAPPAVDVDPALVDAILYRLVVEDEEMDRTAASLDVDTDVVRAVAERHAASRHQRVGRPTPETATTDRYDRFHEIELQFD